MRYTDDTELVRITLFKSNDLLPSWYPNRKKLVTSLQIVPQVRAIFADRFFPGTMIKVSFDTLTMLPNITKS